MSKPKAVISNGWSSLNTVEEFDLGLNENKNIIRKNDNISKTIVKSLFIESLIDQLCNLLEKDPIKRHNLYKGICRKLYEMQLVEDTYHIEELASLRGYYQQALLDIMVTPDTRLCSMACAKLGSSRYATEYEEICFLASGGFGRVFKAKNRLDQVIYAVKKISLRYQNVSTFVKKLNEVKTLAKLNHPNIVQYKAAWLEPLLTPASSIQPKELNSSSSDSDIIVFQNNHSTSTSSNDCLTDPKVIENDKNLALYKSQKRNNVQNSNYLQMSALLYVTMQLCDETLCDWLYNRNFYQKPVDAPLILNIIFQAAAGVQYIHSCNIVHHDIKPRNIFLSNDLKSIQVGDFGLSCCLQGHDHSNCPLEGGQFGTPLYAAPEQLKGLCDPKSDIFSLGLVFIELLTLFSTEMERIEVLTEARSGQLPSSIPPELEPLIKDLVSHIPSKRPTATELLAVLKTIKPFKIQEEKLELISITESAKNFITKTDVNHRLICEEKEQLIKDKDREIIELRQILAQRESEISKLKNLIGQNLSQSQDL